MSKQVFSCQGCGSGLYVDEVWIADEGPLCQPCCKKLYPKKFKCHCGQCWDCNTTHYHNWKTYVGFTDVFDYCDCGEKRRKT